MQPEETEHPANAESRRDTVERVIAQLDRMKADLLAGMARVGCGAPLQMMLDHYSHVRLAAKGGPVETLGGCGLIGPENPELREHHV